MKPTPFSFGFESEVPAGHYVCNFTFDDSPAYRRKIYSYIVPVAWAVNEGDKCLVFAGGLAKQVTCASVGPSSRSTRRLDGIFKMLLACEDHAFANTYNIPRLDAEIRDWQKGRKYHKFGKDVYASAFNAANPETEYVLTVANNQEGTPMARSNQHNTIEVVDETVIVIDGARNNVTAFSDVQLIGIIRDLEDEIKSLGEITTASVRISKRIANLTEKKAKLATLLDARTD